MRTADLKYHVSRLNIFCARKRLSLTWKRSKMIMSLLRYKKATITPNKKNHLEGRYMVLCITCRVCTARLSSQHAFKQLGALLHLVILSCQPGVE